MLGNVLDIDDLITCRVFFSIHVAQDDMTARFASINVILLLFMIEGAVHAQQLNLRFEHLTPQEGLSSSGVRAIEKDTLGFM